jgi:serine/threonine protein kinase/Tfp pilus assembly protein PilF
MSEASSSSLPPHEGNELESGRPDHIGPYRILQVLGEGGMGVVYEAEQTVPVHRRVALKVVRAGSETHDVIARFDSERQALAVMSHESIAKVLDAGTSENGRPYFVMEIVRGIPITEFCDKHKLSVRERVALFIPVCHGVQHAHQKGVIHRDLKPSNVLVTEADDRPLPKIIDFGIAKATGQRLTDATLVTMIGQAIGTPAYMSPEQADSASSDIDTRTDVYSLGVMLYELLVGRLPEDPSETGLQQFLVRLAMRETNPPAPSAKLTTLVNDRESLATLRATDVVGLRRALRGDLDWIVMTAMDQDRNRRYATVNALAADLARFLADEPVQARPPAASYRMRKFVHRHKTGVLAAAAAGIALLAGGTAAATGLVRATRANARATQEAATARQVSSFLVGLFRLSSPDRARGSAVTAREILDSGAARVRTELADQPAVQARLMNTIGDVYQELGLYPEAESLLVRSLAERERLPGDNTRDVAANLTSLGRLYSSDGRYARAESTLKRAAGISETLPAPRTAYTDAIEELAELYRQRGDYARSDSLSRLWLAIAEQALGSDDPDVINHLGVLAASQAEQGRPVAAESLFRRVLALNERTAGPDAARTATAMNNLASALFEQGKLDEADSLYKRGFAIDSARLGPDHPTIALDLYNIANIQSDRGNHERATALYERARRIWEKSLGPEHPYVGAALTSMANSYSSMGRDSAAVPLLREALAIRQKTLAPGHPFIASSYHELGVAELHMRQYEKAEADLDTALALRRKALEPTSYYTGETLEALADLYAATDRYARADSAYRAVLGIWDASGREDRAKRRAATLKSYAALLKKSGRSSNAKGPSTPDR